MVLVKVGEKKKYTFGEWVGITVLRGGVGLLVYVVFLPLGLLAAWMRMKMWDWFIVSYFHLPHIGVWLMFAIGMLLSMYSSSSSQPTLKNEYYAAGAVSRFVVPILCNWVTFGLGYLIHLWILKG